MYGFLCLVQCSVVQLSFKAVFTIIIKWQNSCRHTFLPLLRQTQPLRLSTLCFTSCEDVITSDRRLRRKLLCLHIFRNKLVHEVEIFFFKLTGNLYKLIIQLISSTECPMIAGNCRLFLCYKEYPTKFWLKYVDNLNFSNCAVAIIYVSACEMVTADFVLN